MAQFGTACGAKTRGGKDCQAPAMENGRCRMHGGTNPGASPEAMAQNKNANKFGIYSQFMTDEELDMDIQIGSLEAEIKLVKAQIRRNLKAWTAWDEAHATGDDEEVEALLLLTEVEKQDGERPFGKDADTLPYNGIKKVRKRPDFEGAHARFLARVESLERTHRELGGGTDDMRSAARKFKDAMAEFDDTVPPVPEEQEQQ